MLVVDWCVCVWWWEGERDGSEEAFFTLRGSGRSPAPGPRPRGPGRSIADGDVGPAPTRDRRRIHPVVDGDKWAIATSGLPARLPDRAGLAARP